MGLCLLCPANVVKALDVLFRLTTEERGVLVLVRSAHLSEFLWLAVFTAVTFRVPEDKEEVREVLSPQLWPLTLLMLRRQ